MTHTEGQRSVGSEDRELKHTDERGRFH